MSNPSSPIRKKQPIIPGFRPPVRPKRRPIAEMTIRELQDLHNLNAKLLAAPDASTSSYVQRVRGEQAEIESRLLDVEGLDSISVGLKRTKIKGDNDMEVDEPEPVTSRTIEAKKRALAQYGGSVKPGVHSNQNESSSSTFTLQDAMELERQAYLQEKERQERALEKKRRLGIPIKGEVLTRAEKEARIWAFMNHKPTESDLEEDDDDDDDDDDPAFWFDDDQDDGRKGQDIVEPDFEDLSDIIRIDENRIQYNNFYRPENEGD